MESIDQVRIRLDKNDIYRFLKNRPPFLLIDSAIVEPGKSAEMSKLLSEKEWYFACHFPGNPMMPGVLQLETMFQTGAMAIKILDMYQNTTTNIAQIFSVKYKEHIRPGDKIDVKTEVSQFRRGLARINGTVKVRENICCQAEFLLVVLDDIPQLEGKR